MESPQNIILNGLNSERKTDLNEGFKITFIVKLLFVFGIYEIHDYLHYLHPLLLVLLLSGIHVFITLAIQRPRHEYTLKNKKSFLVLSILGFVQSLCWIFSLLYSGSLRSIVLFGFNDGLRVLVSFCKNPSLRCSGLFYIIGLASSIGNKNAMTGCILSLASNLLSILKKREHLKIDKAIQRADSDVLVDAGSFGILVVCYSFMRLCGYGVLDEPISIVSIVIPMITLAILTRTLPWLADYRKLKFYCHPKTSVLWYRYELFTAFLFGYIWDHPVTTKVSGLMRDEIIVRKSHELETDIVILSLCFLMADWYWRGRPSSLIVVNTNRGRFKLIFDFIARISEDPLSRSKTFFAFLSIVISALTCVSAAYNNSLALFAAGLLTLFHSNNVILSLVGGLVSSSKPSKMFNFGLSSLEILIDYLLSVSMVSGSLLILKQSVERIASTADISTEFSLLISVFSIFLNLGGFGLFGDDFLRKSGVLENSNLCTEMVIANSGYAAIMLSVVLNDWKIFDPIAAFGIASLVGYKTLSILKSSSEIMMLRCPSSIEREFKEALHKIMQLKEVESYRNHRCWTVSPKVFCCSIVLQINESAVENTIICVAGQYFKEAGITEITIQCEKDICHSYLAGSQSQTAKTKFEWIKPKNQHSDIFI